MIAHLFLALLAIAATQPPPQPPGMLCIGDAACVATAGEQVQVVPAPHARRYVWTSEDRTVVAFGTLAAEQSALKIVEGSSRAVRLSTHVRDEVAFTIESAGGNWLWSMKDPPPLIRLLHPPCGDCLLRVEAKGFRPYEKPLRVVREIALVAWPRVTGRVVDGATNLPVAGATITVAEVLAGKSGIDGRFELTLEGKWPHALDVAYPGRARTRLVLPRVPGPGDVGDVVLSKGGALSIVLDPPIAQEAKWEVRDTTNYDLLRSGTIAPGAAEAFAEALAAGEYSVVVRGARPLQQFGKKVTVEDGAVATMTVAIQPVQLTIEATQGSKPVTGTIDLRGAGFVWRGSVTLDAEGRVIEELWQRGTIGAMLTSPLYVAETRADSDEVTWRITIDDRTISGRVVDASTGTPLAHATVNFEPAADGPGLQMFVKTDAEGRFTIDAVKAGTHRLTARADGYKTIERRPITIPDATGTYPEEFRMESLTREGRTLALTDERNAPIVNAVVFLGDREGLREIGATGTDGRCPVPLAPDESGVLFVIPRSGSFAFNRIAPQRGDEDVIAMRVRSGSAAIEVTARDKDGKPVPNILLVPRINGMMIPPEVLSALRNYQGTSFSTDATGTARITRVPPGVYELWAVAGQDQMRALRSASPPPPAASLEVETGRYAIALELAAR